MGLAVAACLHLWKPPEDTRSSICLFRRTVGIPCPGCGLTRAFAHLAKGEWSAAVADHPLAPLLAAEFGLGWLAWGLALRGRFPWAASAPSWLPPLLLSQVAVLFFLWIGRLSTGTLP